MEQHKKTTIYSLAYGGSGVGKIENKICFVEGALPGEDVVFEITKDNPRYVQGKVIEILNASDDRVELVCRYYSECGGCQLQHISYEKELFYKKMQVEELIQRIGGAADIKVEDIEPSKDSCNYRSSITLHRKNGMYGYYRRDGRGIIEIEECSIASNEINREIPGLKELSKKDDITLKSDSQGKVWHSDRMGERFFIDKYRNKELYFSPKAFSQANRHISTRIVEVLEEWIDDVETDTAFFDIYCGVGFFSFLLEKDFCLRVGMDEDRTAIDCAKSAVKDFGLEGFKFYRADVKKGFMEIYEKNKRKNNVIFIDPSRKGAGKGILEDIKKCRGIRSIYYLSCDPACLARDIKIFTESGEWKLSRIKPFDMFPRTKHIEVLSEFVKI